MTRIELRTSPASGGVAVVALHGPEARARLGRLGVATGAGRGPRLVRLSIGGEDLDEALVVQLAEDEFELHLHGSPPLVDEVLGILRAGTDRDAPEPAADAPRTLAERAWQRLGAAPSELGARILLDQAEGAFETEVRGLADLPGDELAAAAVTLLERGRVARRLLEPTTMVLTGAVNVGKSTLFNALVGSERTLVSHERGTTRDAIAERASLGPWPVLIVDTAGRRELAGAGGQVEVERAGQQLAASVRREAGWVLELRRASADVGPGAVPVGDRTGANPNGSISSISTCCDRLPRDRGSWPLDGVSAREEPRHAAERVQGLFEATFDLPGDPAELWRAGRAVPFEDAHLEVLRALRMETAPGPALSARLQALLR